MIRKMVVAVGVIGLVSGCGGGGGESSTPSTPVVEITNYPVESNLSAFFAKPATYNLSASDGKGNSYALNFQLTPGADKILPGSSIKTPLKTFRYAAAVSVNSGPAIRSESEVYFSVSPFKILGANGGAFEKYANELNPAPSNSNVGDSGTLAAGYLTDAGGNLIDQYSRIISWKLERETASTAWLCLDTYISTTTPSRETDCARINSSGIISGFKATAVTSGITLNFK